MLVTTTDLLIVDVEESFLIRGQTRLPRARIQRIEVAPTQPVFADFVLHTTAGGTVALRGLFRDQARRLADHLRGQPLANP